MLHFDEAAVHAALTLDRCIPAMRQAMIVLSEGDTLQLPRAMIGMGERRTFGVMAGALGADGYFGSKLVSVFADPAQPGRTRHQGLVVLFAGDDGRPLCTLDAGAVTEVRTAAATAMATAALARQDADTLALLGCGRQAFPHLEAIAKVRQLRRVLVWGRSPERAAQFAREAEARFGLKIEVGANVQATVAEAEIVCTLTGARQSVLEGAWLPPGVHVNLVGSSGPGPTEVDDALVARGRYIVESRENARLAAAEFINALAAGAVGENHIAAEIGEVLAGRLPGRTSPQQVTVYKSLGHVVQDLAAAVVVYERHHPGTPA